MTREEAITNIVMIRSVFLDHLTQEQKEIIDNTFDMAIEALSAESCEDCISRQATVERLCKVAEFMNEKRNGLGSPYVMAALFIQDNKDEFPPVAPKPKTDVLDKIRAEIELNRNEWIKGKDAEWHTYDRCLFIIDKYTAEKE